MSSWNFSTRGASRYSLQTIFYNLLNSRRHIHKHTTDGQIDGRKIWKKNILQRSCMGSIHSATTGFCCQIFITGSEIEVGNNKRKRKNKKIVETIFSPKIVQTLGPTKIISVWKLLLYISSLEKLHTLAKNHKKLILEAKILVKHEERRRWGDIWENDGTSNQNAFFTSSECFF